MKDAVVQRNGREISHAFEREVAPHLPGLRVYAFRLAGNHHDADDITQEAMLRAIRGFPRFRGDCPVRSWLFTIATNVWRDSVRRPASRPAAALLEFPDRLACSERLPCSFDRPEAVVAGQLDGFSQRTARVLLDLPRDLRAALLLAYVGGLSQRELGAVLGWSPGKVRSRLFATRERLRRRLAGGVR